MSEALGLCAVVYICAHPDQFASPTSLLLLIYAGACAPLVPDQPNNNCESPVPLKVKRFPYAVGYPLLYACDIDAPDTAGLAVPDSQVTFPLETILLLDNTLPLMCNFPFIFALPSTSNT